MKKLLKKIFCRLNFVILSILLQITLSLILPYVLSYYYPNIFGNLVYIVNSVFSILGIILTIRIINSDMITEGKLIWAILILLMPVLGILLYFFFVRRRPPRVHKELYKSVAIESKKCCTKTDEEDKKLKKDLGDMYGNFQYIFNTTGMKVYSNTDVKYLKIGEEFFEELLKELQKAKKYIFMEYFIIEEGKFWNTLLETLKTKVQEGVDVRVMYDDIGCINKLKTNYYKTLNKMGIKCVRFNAFRPILSAAHNNRDHRKMTIIDGNVGFMSGLNLADEYINYTHPYGHWKDTGIKITGDAVRNMLIMFLQTFAIQNLKMEEFSPYLDALDTSKIQNAKGFVCPYGDGPKYFYNEDVASNVYMNVIGQAKNYLWITTPYLIMDSKLTNALCNAARRGVDVRIITPHVPDKKIIFGLTRSSYRTLQKAGVKIFEYAKGFIHSKQVLCDDEVATLGTINFDYRSLLHNYECGTLMYKTNCLADMKKDFENLFEISIDMQDFKFKPLTRLFYAIIKLFTPLL